MDRYEKRARIYPAVVSLLCPGIFMAIIFHDYLPDFNASVGKLSILASCSISALVFGSVGFFMRSVFRVTSKYLFQLPFVKLDETFMPTTNLLLWKDSFYSKEKKQRIYDKIRMKYGIDLLPETVKRMKELDTRKKIAEAVSCIRIDFRRSEGDKRIVENCNIQIGMFRNYLGGAVYACMLITATIVLNGIFSFTGEWVSSVVVIVIQLLFIALSIIGLKMSAKEYAKNLIDYFDTSM